MYVAILLPCRRTVIRVGVRQEVTLATCDLAILEGVDLRTARVSEAKLKIELCMGVL